MKLKICGIRDIDILKYTCDMRVNFAGFIMPDDSPRKISNNFISSLENFNFKDTLPVFVFVNPSRAEVLEITTKFNNAILVDESKIRNKISRLREQNYIDNILLSEIIFTINENFFGNTIPKRGTLSWINFFRIK